MTDLSPAAQAVLDAASDRWLDVDDDIPAQVAAAALRAAAGVITFPGPESLLAIAAELETSTTKNR
jgi:hypothetical protein